ncbi:hypothetical protein ACUOAQ_32245 [Escherichia sp. SP-MK]
MEQIRFFTYKDLINKINDGDYGVSAYTLGGKVFMSAKNEGMGGEIKFTSEKSDLFQKMGLSTVDGKAVNVINEAQDAIYSINGIEGKSASNTIETLPGVKVELLKVTESKVTDGGTGTDTKGIDLKFTVSDSNVLLALFPSMPLILYIASCASLMTLKGKVLVIQLKHSLV